LIVVRLVYPKAISARKRALNHSRSSQPPPRGTKEQQMASAPCGARLKMLLLLFKSLAAQVGRFAGSSFSTLARRSNCCCGRWATTHGYLDSREPNLLK
jgi:hypothetical protein